MISAEDRTMQMVDRIGGRLVPDSPTRNAPLRHLDPSLIGIALVLGVYGAAMVHSASAGRPDGAAMASTFFTRQVWYGVAGLIAIAAIASFDYRRLRALAPFAYGVTLVLLAAVLTPLGEEVSGARRWLSIGPVQLQPSEFAKAAVLIALAAYLARQKGCLRARHVVVACILTAIPAAAIFLEPDLGTMIVLVALVGLVLVVGGAKLRHLLALALLGLTGIVTAVNAGLVHDYQIERVTAFLDDSPDVRSVGYNLTQSKIAIASGGIRGQGFGASDTQTALSFVPEQHTDFIFTAVGEQLGFIGSAFLLGAFALLIWRALRIAAMARDLFGALLAAGIAGLWAVQVFVNVGMTMGIMPITGIPLPFISYGGSSLLTNFILVGVLLNVHMRRHV